MQRILIIKLGALGDILIAAPHIQQIARSFPESDIRLLTMPGFAPLFEEYPNLRVKSFPRKGAQSLLPPLRWIRSQAFQVIFDLQGNDRSKIMTALSGAAKRYGLGSGFPYTRCPPNKGIVKGESHSFHRLNRLLETANLTPVSARLTLRSNAEQRQAVGAWLVEQGLSEKSLVLFHAGSSERWESKRWPAAHFTTLATILEQRGWIPIWVGGVEDALLNRQLSQLIGIDATGCFSLLQLIELARYARFAVTTDSAPMHAIAAAGTPVYALFGPTDWQRSHALGQKERVLTHPVACSPCYLPQCPVERAHQCLAELKPEAVLERIRRDGLME